MSTLYLILPFDFLWQHFWMLLMFLGPSHRNISHSLHLSIRSCLIPLLRHLGCVDPPMSGQSLWLLTKLSIIQMAQIMLNSLRSLSFHRVLTWILFTLSEQKRKSFLHPWGKGWYASGSLPAVGSWAVHRYVGPLAGIRHMRLLCQTASHLHNKIKNA